MPDVKIGTGSPIQEYIRSVTQQIKDAQTEELQVGGLIEIEMSTVLEKQKSGGLRIGVLDLGAKVSENNIHKIKVPFRVVTEYYKKYLEAKMAEEEARKKDAQDYTRGTY